MSELDTLSRSPSSPKSTPSNTTPEALKSARDSVGSQIESISAIENAPEVLTEKAPVASGGQKASTPNVKKVEPTGAVVKEAATIPTTEKGLRTAIKREYQRKITNLLNEAQKLSQKTTGGNAKKMAALVREARKLYKVTLGLTRLAMDSLVKLYEKVFQQKA